MHSTLRSVAVLSAALLAVTTPAIAAASIEHPAVVSEDPTNFTPNVEDDAQVARAQVYALGQVGETMYAGGNFHTVRDARKRETYTRDHIMGFDATTGAMRNFSPAFDGPVWGIAPSGSSLFVGGKFKTVNGVTRKGIAKIDATTGEVDARFNARLRWGKVTEVRLVDGRVIIGGTFPGKLLALDPVTGEDTGYIDVPITGKVANKNGTTNSGATDIYRFAVDPAGTRLVAIGNFTSVGGEARSRAFMLSLGDTSASVNEWYYEPLQNSCRADRIPQYLRDVDFSPSGGYFVLVSSGFIPQAGGQGRDICDAAARFETAIASPARPTWINYTGGDTLHSVAATGAAVYVQGHQRWLDNGATPRPGIGAIDPQRGVALGWNPTKTRAVGGRELYATHAGLWVGSDGRRFGSTPSEYRSGLAFVPLP